MKTFLILILLFGGAYLGYPHLPANVKATVGATISALNPLHLLPPLASSAQRIKRAVTPAENPVEKRAALIQKLQKNLETLSSQTLNPAGRAALRDSEAALTGLMAENDKSGLLGDLTKRVANLVLPSAATTSPACTY